MSNETTSESANSWVLFKLRDRGYGIKTDMVREMVLFDKPSKLPDHPDYVRGVINLRGRVFPIIDLRVRLGMTGAIQENEELVDLLSKREEDHINWLKELKASVEENREFTLTTDPHACAFGKWYDHFKTDHQLLRSLLFKFDAPHKAIHNIAVEVKKLRDRGDIAEAMATIQNTWNNELGAMRSLFRQAKILISDTNREIVFVIEIDGVAYGLVVDSVEDVLDIQPSQIESSPALKNGKSSEYICGLAKIGDQVKILLDTESLIGSAEISEAELNHQYEKCLA